MSVQRSSGTGHTLQMKNGQLLPTHQPSRLYISITTSIDDDDDDGVSMVTSILLLEQATFSYNSNLSDQVKTLSTYLLPTDSLLVTIVNFVKLPADDGGLENG